MGYININGGNTSSGGGGALPDDKYNELLARIQNIESNDTPEIDSIKEVKDFISTHQDGETLDGVIANANAWEEV